MPLPDDQNVPQEPSSDDAERFVEGADPAPLEFGGNSRQYQQIWRSANIAVLEVRIPNGPVTSYETVVIRIQGAYERFGKSYPAKELYPNNEQFGKLGWSFGIKHKALALEAAELLVGVVGVPGKTRREVMQAFLARQH